MRIVALWCGLMFGCALYGQEPDQELRYQEFRYEDFRKEAEDKIAKINPRILTDQELLEADKSVPTFSFRSFDAPEYAPTEFVPTDMGKTYQQGLNHILSKKEKKAYKYFQGVLKKKSPGRDKEHAAFQLAHYDWYGCFDVYYNGVPSKMDRQQLNSSVEPQKRHSFVEANDETFMLMCANPKLPSYNLEQTIVKGAELLGEEKIYCQELGEAMLNMACDPNVENTISLYDIYLKHFYGGTRIRNCYQITLTLNVFSISNLAKTLPYISRMPQVSSNTDVGKTAKELYEIAEQARKEKDYVKAHYHFLRAALYGDVKSLIKIYEEHDEHIEYLYTVGVLKKYAENMLHDRIYTGERLAENLVKCEGLKDFHEINKRMLKEKARASDIYYNQRRRERLAEEARKEARRERRLQFWSGVLQGASQAMNMTMNQMAMVQQNQFAYNQTPIMSGVGNMDFLLDPRFAVAQVNEQEQAEYQQAREGAQRIGKDLSIDEWRTMKGQAIQNLKNEGYDIIAERQKIIDDNKAFNEEMRQRERKDRLNQYNMQLGGASSVPSSSQTSTKPINQHSSSGAGVKTTNEVNNQQNNQDSKEQYRSKPVDSSDYQYVKHVDIYIRDGNSNRVMFSNKELCKKGANYYVKIGNMCYLVQTGGGWGFNSSILYSSSKLYFNR